MKRLTNGFLVLMPPPPSSYIMGILCPVCRSLHSFLWNIFTYVPCGSVCHIPHPLETDRHTHRPTLLSSGSQVYISDSPLLGDRLFPIPLLQSGEVVVNRLLAMFCSLRTHRQVASRPRRQTPGADRLGWSPSLSTWFCDLGKLIQPLCLSVLPCGMGKTLSTFLVFRIKCDSNWSVNSSSSLLLASPGLPILLSCPHISHICLITLDLSCRVERGISVMKGLWIQYNPAPLLYQRKKHRPSCHSSVASFCSKVVYFQHSSYYLFSLQLT